ncbi:MULTISPECIES: LacI family DNA-binding transcriptional regulator [unclassified Microbacterium]|uniref:LacI family DNA-binding transcriptional regulator n=1 Tax=unclassified Microbacterium TaxID=2609290 RepID=UPI000EA9EA8D|nr:MULTISPECIES: LacI family DNA-binding transcriptional regulator [unclassified Microbacterium]MBT2483266.1 LacI family DNA-binding transcriptional regulator [Microbacterium sp. ISL-108]RKN66307.1 LacI family transcriptional regulator [Microbacterium sp. CGR2]
MSTIADVAARAGVSKATASRALSGRGYVSETTRRQVADAARDLAYVAHSSATSLATGRTQTVGVVMPPVDRWFHAELLAGIQESLLALEYDLSLYGVPESSPARERLFERILPRRRFDGIIAVGIMPSTVELERLQRSGPLVCVGPHAEESDAVGIDDSAAARIATEHLIELGHTAIAFLGGSTDAATLSVGDARRLAGYGEALQAAGLGAHARVAGALPTMPGGYAGAAGLLGDRRNRPTAIVAVCDEAAIGAVIAARSLGIAVPTELSVVGIDDHEHAEMFSLTTIGQSPREQGHEAVRLLTRRMAHPDAPLEPAAAASALVMRSSTAAPR